MNFRGGNGNRPTHNSEGIDLIEDNMNKCISFGL